MNGTTGTARSVPELLVIADLQTLQSGLHDQSVCETTWGTPLAPDTVRRLACQANIIPVVMNGHSQVLDVGRAQRLATPAQRRAVIARDRRCVFGCHAPPQWCDVHHDNPWETGGPTDLDNFSLVCERHHHLIHEGGWQLKRSNGVLEIRRPDGTLYNKGPT